MHKPKRLAHLLLLGTMALAPVACDTAPPDQVEGTEQALGGVWGTPAGLTCGIAYQKLVNGRFTRVVDGSCAGTATLNFTPAFNFNWASDGDRGLSSGEGFFHQKQLNNTGSVNTTNISDVALPWGTACGFKEACNDSGETCFGFNANVSCPSGWVRRTAADLNAPGGCNFVWCEYQDPHFHCDDRSCLGNMPAGTACGITDSDLHNGRCMGNDPASTTSQRCPVGFQSFGFFDWGRSSGHGVGWCAKM